MEDLGNILTVLLIKHPEYIPIYIILLIGMLKNILFPKQTKGSTNEKSIEDAHKCTIYAKICNEDHKWDGCKCVKCGDTRDNGHSWDGNKCTKYGISNALWRDDINKGNCDESDWGSSLFKK